MGQLRPKMVHPHNSGTTVRIVLQYCTMKGAKRDMEIILMVFLEKKFNLGQFGHFGPKMEHPHNFGSASDFFLILHNARGQEVHEMLLVVFEKKSHLGQFDLFRPFFTV